MRKWLLLGALLAVGGGFSGEAVTANSKRSGASFELLPEPPAKPQPPTQARLPQVSDRQEVGLASVGGLLLWGWGMMICTRLGGGRD